MTFEAYVPLVTRTETPPNFAFLNLIKKAWCQIEDLQENVALIRGLHAVIGLCTELGELVDDVENARLTGKLIDIVNFRAELGDLCWYEAILRDSFDYRIYPVWTNVSAGDGLQYTLNRLTGIVGNLMDFYKRWMFYGKEPDVLALSTVVDTFSFLLATLCYSAGTTVEEVRRVNIAKLQKRYPEKFDAEAAINRDEAAERQVLENA